MAFLQLKSSNPMMSYIIRKNPASIMQAKEMRKGVAFGYFTKAPSSLPEGVIETFDIYNIYFQDGANEISYPEFKDQEFEYVNATRYSSTQFVLNAIAEFLREPLKKLDEENDIEGFEHTLTMNLIRLEGRRMLGIFQHHFADTCEIQANEVANRHYQIIFKTNKSIHYLINLVNLFCCFIVLKNEHEYIHLDDGAIEKYFTSLSVIDAPYFVRYAFKSDLLRSFKWFNQYKPLLETSSRYQIKLEYGNTILMRMEWVKAQLSFTNGIVDVGCGEGVYLNFAKNIGGKQYYAIDINETCRHIIKKKAKNKNLNNVHVLESLDLDIMDLEISDFLLLEVLEHMPKEEAEKMLRLCLMNPRCNSVIITTPNKDFNGLYFDNEDKEVRREDHHFEFTEAEFREWLERFEAKEKKVFQVGDIVDGKSVTLGAVLRR